jgi:hypothetical protein
LRIVLFCSSAPATAQLRQLKNIVGLGNGGRI